MRPPLPFHHTRPPHNYNFSNKYLDSGIKKVNKNFTVFLHSCHFVDFRVPTNNVNNFKALNITSNKKKKKRFSFLTLTLYHDVFFFFVKLSNQNNRCLFHVSVCIRESETKKQRAWSTHNDNIFFFSFFLSFFSWFYFYFILLTEGIQTRRCTSWRWQREL